MQTLVAEKNRMIVERNITMSPVSKPNHGKQRQTSLQHGFAFESETEVSPSEGMSWIDSVRDKRNAGQLIIYTNATATIPMSHEASNWNLQEPEQQAPNSRSRNSEIEKAIAQSRTILDMPENWNDEGAPKISEEAFDSATSFLLSFAQWVLDGFHIVIPVPKIRPVPDGGINLKWAESSFRLLINIPAETPKLGNFYGVRGDSGIEGDLELNGEPFMPFAILSFFMPPLNV